MRLWFVFWTVLVSAQVALALPRPMRSASASKPSPAAPAPSAVAPAGQRRVAVLPFERIGAVAPEDAQAQVSLRQSIGALPETQSFELPAPRCRADDAKCLSGVGRKNGATHVASGSIERFADGYALRLQLVDVGAQTKKEDKRLISGGAAELIAALELSACTLIVSGECRGRFIVSGADGARLLLNGRDLGALPFRSDIGLGRHQVRVVRDGRSTEDRTLVLSHGQQIEWQVQDKGGRLSFVEESEALPLPPELVLPDLPPDVEVAEPVAAKPAPAPVALAAVEPPAAVAKTEPVPAPVSVPVLSASPAAVPKEAPARPRPNIMKAPAAAVVVDEPPPTTAAVPEPPSAPAEPASPRSARWLTPAFQGAVVATGVGLLAGIVLGAVAQGRASSLNADFDQRVLQPADAERYGSIRATATAANVFYGLGSVAAAGAAALYVIQPKVLDDSLRLFATPTGVGAAGSF
jgi:hypothetical protein